MIVPGDLPSMMTLRSTAPGSLHQLVGSTRLLTGPGTRGWCQALPLPAASSSCLISRSASRTISRHGRLAG